MGEDSDAVDTGGEPETIGRCTECERVYPVQFENGDLRPVGTGGTCLCGCGEFELVTES